MGIQSSNSYNSEHQAHSSCSSFGLKLVFMKIVFFILMLMNFYYGQEHLLLKLSVPFILLVMHLVFGENRYRSCVCIIVITTIISTLSYIYTIPFPLTTSLISSTSLPISSAISLFLIHQPNTLQVFSLKIYFFDFVISYYLSSQDSYQLKIVLSAIALLFYADQQFKNMKNTFQGFSKMLMKLQYELLPYLIVGVIFYQYDKAFYTLILIFIVHNLTNKSMQT